MLKVSVSRWINGYMHAFEKVKPVKYWTIAVDSEMLADACGCSFAEHHAYINLSVCYKSCDQQFDEIDWHNPQLKVMQLICLFLVPPIVCPRFIPYIFMMCLLHMMHICMQYVMHVKAILLNLWVIKGYGDWNHFGNAHFVWSKICIYDDQHLTSRSSCSFSVVYWTRLAPCRTSSPTPTAWRMCSCRSTMGKCCWNRRDGWSYTRTNKASHGTACCSAPSHHPWH